MVPEWLKEAAVIIVALGGLELVLWWRQRSMWADDKKRQEEQLEALESIKEELIEINDTGIQVIKDEKEPECQKPPSQR
jgi:hypothetical protein